MKVTESSYSAEKLFFLLWQPGTRLACCATVGGGYDKGEIKEKCCSGLGGGQARRRREEADGGDESYVGTAVLPHTHRLPWPVCSGPRWAEVAA